MRKNLKKPKPKIIEITGLPHRAKTLLGRMLAARHGGYFIDFPNFSPESYTGMLLAQEILNKRIFKEPNWWAYMSAANLAELLPNSLGKNLVVYSNYKTSYHALFKGGYDLSYTTNIIKHLPEPNKIFLLKGSSINYTSVDFSLHPTLTRNIERYYNYNFNSKRFTHIELDDLQFESLSLTVRLNKVLNYMSKELEDAGWPVLVKNTIPNINLLTR